MTSKQVIETGKSRLETHWLPGSGGFELANVVLSIHLKFHANLSRDRGTASTKDFRPSLPDDFRVLF
jgi:hypothetical protein